MESRWRQNVADLGWSFSSWRLAARLLNQPGRFYVVAENDPPFRRGFLWVHFLAEDLWVRLFALPGGSFPYGLTVEPDHP